MHIPSPELRDPPCATNAGPSIMRPWGQDLTEVQDDDDVFSSSEEEGSLDGQDSDNDSEGERFHGPATTSEKRRQQNEVFKSFAAQRLVETTEKEVRESIKDEKDERLSIQAILKKQDSSARIVNARDYQTELYQKASEENVIAVLDTGTGKTHIATLLLRHILDQELEDRAKGRRHKLAFFLVNSVNLVFQQLNVLQCGLDQKVEGLCGAMGASKWRKDTWEKIQQNNMVVVCTGEVLVQCMMHSFLSMRDVNLLIFDEAHHAKGNHSYARLMKDYYYTELDQSQRPRIFGMTASPVDANVDIKTAAKELETLLDCKIATVSNQTLLANHINTPTESIQFYNRLPDPCETPFYQEMKSRYGEIPAFRKLFDQAKLLSSELGRWASDTYWSFALSEEEGRKVEVREERKFHQLQKRSVDQLNKEIKQLQEAAAYVRGHAFRPPNVDLEDLNSKVLALHNILTGYYERTGDARCIVFVEKRATARLLSLIFSHIGGPNLHSDILVGSNSIIGDMTVSVRSQFLVGAKFRRGDLNCLFATSVAEEGLDIPECNVVVRFDLYRTMISYVQSRGRARHRNSRYIHMLEQGNFVHQETLRRAHLAEKEMRNFCNELPADRLIGEPENDIAKLLDNEADFPSYTDPVSGAKLTFTSSISVLAHFVACLPSADVEVSLLPTYMVERLGGRYIAEVVLPECSPIISMRGKPCSRKAIARCSAAFEMCKELRERKFLDENLLPTFRKVLPAMRNALLAVSSKTKDQYPMRIKPEFWETGYGTIPEKLYLTVIDVSAGLERPHQPIGLVTRAPMPELPEFPIYLADGTPSQVVSMPLQVALPVTKENLELLTRLTLEIYEDIFAKVYEEDAAKMSYWLVPLLTEKTVSITPFENPTDLIDWNQVRVAVYEREVRAKGEKGDYRWTPEMPNDFLADKYIVDINDGGRRFWSTGVVPNLKATDQVPDDAPKYKWMDNILEYSISLWQKSREKWVDHWDRSQPVIKVEKIPFRRNFLSYVEKDEDEVKWNPVAYVCPEPLKISALSTRFVAMCYVFPAIVHRFESYLVAIDATKRLGLDISPGLALEALTKDSDNSDEHGEVKINFKSGMGPNYERLEFMGDCFLKMATSISCFVMNPNENEFEFHVRRMQMLCNRNLLGAARKLQLYEYVRSMAFSRRTWYPKGLKMLKGKGSKQQDDTQVIKHRLADKALADVCEAFIGAAFMQHNRLDDWKPEDWDQAVKAVKILVDSDDHEMGKYADYFAAYDLDKPKYQLAEATASQLDLAQKVEQKHPYHFKYPRLLRSAFVHPSQPFAFEKVPNYQRLEFLGDALLDQAFVTHLFYRYPDKDPQWLTEHKMPMVSNKFLGAVCVKLGFHTHLRQNNTKLSTDIRDYVLEVEEAEREAKGAVDYWMHVTADTPKCLGDIVEAYVAAMFVDSSFDFRVVQDFFDMHLRRYMVDMSIYDGFAGNHPVTRLNKLLQDSFGCQEYRMSCMTQESVIPGVQPQQICMIQIHWTVHFHATGQSNRYAQPRAAARALEKLEGLPPFEFRRLYGCDCQTDSLGSDGGNGVGSVVGEKSLEAVMEGAESLALGGVDDSVEHWVDDGLRVGE